MLCSHFSVDLIGNNVQRSDASPSQTWARVHSPAQQRCPDLLFCTLGPCKDNGLCLWSVAKNTHWENGDPLSPSRVSKPDRRFLILVGLQLSQGSKTYKSVSAGMSEWPAEFPPAGQGSDETRPSNQGLHKTIEAALNLKFFPEWAARHRGETESASHSPESPSSWDRQDGELEGCPTHWFPLCFESLCIKKSRSIIFYAEGLVPTCI